MLRHHTSDDTEGDYARVGDSLLPAMRMGAIHGRTDRRHGDGSDGRGAGRGHGPAGESGHQCHQRLCDSARRLLRIFRAPARPATRCRRKLRAWPSASVDAGGQQRPDGDAEPGPAGGRDAYHHRGHRRGGSHDLIRCATRHHAHRGRAGELAQHRPQHDFHGPARSQEYRRPTILAEDRRSAAEARS